MKSNKLSNEPKDWLKALNIINLFTIVFCVFINKTDFIIPLFVIFTFAGFAGFIIFGLINKLIVKYDKAKAKKQALKGKQIKESIISIDTTKL